MSLLPLGAALVVLMIDSAIELSLISSMVGYLHRSGANKYPFDLGDGTSAVINAKPAGLLLNEGHTSNGAAGTALVLICFGGFLVLWHQRQRERKRNAVLISFTLLGDVTNEASERSIGDIASIFGIYDLYHPLVSPDSLCPCLYFCCLESNKRTNNRQDCRGSIPG